MNEEYNLYIFLYFKDLQEFLNKFEVVKLYSFTFSYIIYIALKLSKIFSIQSLKIISKSIEIELCDIN